MCGGNCDNETTGKRAREDAQKSCSLGESEVDNVKEKGERVGSETGGKVVKERGNGAGSANCSGAGGEAEEMRDMREGE